MSLKSHLTTITTATTPASQPAPLPMHQRGKPGLPMGEGGATAADRHPRSLLRRLLQQPLLCRPQMDLEDK